MQLQPEAQSDLLLPLRDRTHRLSQSFVLSTTLHVEGLDLGWETTEQDGLVDSVSHHPLWSLRDVLTQTNIIYYNILMYLVFADTLERVFVPMFSSYLSKLVVGAVVLLHIMLSEPLNGFTVVHPLKRPLGRLEVLKEA